MHYKSITNFIKSVKDFASAHIGEYILRWVEDCIKEIGGHRVLQVITDNASANMVAKNMMAWYALHCFGAVMHPTQLT